MSQVSIQKNVDCNYPVLGWYGILGVMTSVPVQLIFVERSVRINNNNKTILIISLILA